MKEFKSNTKALNFDPQRRRSLKDLSLLSFAGLALMNLHKERNQEEFLLSPSFEHSFLQNNIPEKLLSLPLQYFHLPFSFEIILKEQRLRYKDTKFIIPLMSFSNDLHLDYKANAFNHNQDFNFLTYHYENLNSLIKDLEQKNFYMRSFDFNRISFLEELLCFLIIDGKRNATALVDVKEEKYIIDDYTFYSKELNSLELKKCTIYQLPCSHSLFKNFRNKEKQIDAFKKDEDSPIHAYNEVLQILQDFANGIYNVKYEKGKFKEDKNKARRLLEKLNIIGQNNLKAMYMKIEEKEIQNQNKIRQNDFNQIIIDKNKDQKSPPNFIGRLATTIIIEDGLYLG